MSLQAQLDKSLIETATQYDGINSGLQDFAIAEINRVRFELQEKLATYANKDNVIAKNRIKSLLAELETIERQVYENGMQAMQAVIDRTADESIKASSTALTQAVGGQGVVNGAMFDVIKANTVQYVVNRFGNDGLVLSDRVWQFAGTQRAELEQVLRSGIIRGESVNTLVAKVRKVYDNDTWKIRRLVVTEGNIAYRTANSYTAQRSPFVKALRIHRGIHDIDRHRCSELEGINRYGLGKGVYLPDDPEVLNPHPNCTSYVTYVLVDKAVNEVKKAEKKDKEEKKQLANLFKNDALPFGTNDKGALTVGGQPVLGSRKLDEATINKIAKLKNEQEFKNMWYSMEDNGELTENHNKVFTQLEDLFKLKGTLYKVPDYNVGFGRVDAKQLGDKAFKLNKAFNEDEITAIEQYTGSASTAINQFWREKQTGNDHAVEMSQALDSAMEKSDLKDNVMLYRGAGYDAVGGRIVKAVIGGNKEDIIGAEIQDLGYMSTSIGANTMFKKEVTFQIKAPAGTKGIFVEDTTSTKGELEVILARGTKLKIQDAQAYGTKIHLLVEVVGNGE